MSAQPQSISFELTLALSELGKLCGKVLAHLANQPAQHDNEGYVLLLRGEIGAGKTSFVKALLEQEQVQNLAKPSDPSNPTAHIIGVQNVTSPTFSLAQSYESALFGELHHYDLYRKSLEEMLSLGLLDMLSLSGLHLIEWGDESLENLLRTHGFRLGTISIATAPDTHSRIYKVAL